MLTKNEYTLEDVLELCREYMNENHVEFVKKAFVYAEKAHEGVMRKSGEPFIDHPVQVAGVLAELNMDPATIAAGFLHDVVEDTDRTLEDLKEIFSEDVAQIVDGVTKLGQYTFSSKEEAQAENHRKMLLAMAQDIRVIIVKLSDRLHNMRTLQYHRPEKQKIIANETLEIYAPLADRLGISRIKWELEDISLRYLNPQQYYRIVHLMNSRREEREGFVKQTIDMIQGILDELEIEGEITGRPKHIYSIYRKMTDQHKQFEEIYDLLAVRVITESVKDCYATLGSIHTEWKPIPGRFKDYIALPKANLYQSLHTTVLGPHATPVEVQIRTREMHEIAEFGVAAHWAYKEGSTQQVQKDELSQALSWFKDFDEYQDDAADAADFINSVKEDILKDKVYVFTPGNDVIELPTGSSTLDFAYHVHTEVGNKSTGSRVNGRLVPLNYKLKNGDIVEMITSASSYGPSRDWLNYVNTSKARNRIKRYFKTQDKDKNIERGQAELEHAISDRGHKSRQVIKQEADRVLERFNYKSLDELYQAIGFGEVRLTTVVNYFLRNIEEKEQRERENMTASEIAEQSQKGESILGDTHSSQKEKMKIKHDGGVAIEGGSNLLIRLSGCCNPLPGDDIIGYITKGRGVSIHRRDCPNVQLDEEYGKRLIEVEWQDSQQQGLSYDAEIQVEGFDRAGLFNDIMQVFSNLDESINVTNIDAHVDKATNLATIRLTVGISNKDELEFTVDKVKNVPDVYSVKRVIS